MTRFERLWERTQKEIPGVRIVLRKDSVFLGFIFGLLSLPAKLLGRPPKDYSGFSTTIGRTLYSPDDFWDWGDDAKYERLRHELQHLRQFRCWPFQILARDYVWVVNAFLMGFCYMFVLPVRWTKRAQFEREGYYQSILVRYELGHLRSVIDRNEMANWLADTFSNGSYAWMWDWNEAYLWAMGVMNGFDNDPDVLKHPDNVDSWA